VRDGVAREERGETGKDEEDSHEGSFAFP